MISARKIKPMENNAEKKCADTMETITNKMNATKCDCIIEHRNVCKQNFPHFFYC